MSNNRDEMYMVINELQVAQKRFPPYQSAHEGAAVIREEYLEFEKAVYHGTGKEAYIEAKQLAAMALRYMVDINTRGRNIELVSRNST